MTAPARLDTMAELREQIRAAARTQLDEARLIASMPKAENRSVTVPVPSTIADIGWLLSGLPVHAKLTSVTIGGTEVALTLSDLADMTLNFEIPPVVRRGA